MNGKYCASSPFSFKTSWSYLIMIIWPLSLQTALAEKGSGEEASGLESDSTPTKRGVRSLSRRDRDLPPAGKDKSDQIRNLENQVEGPGNFH